MLLTDFGLAVQVCIQTHQYKTGKVVSSFSLRCWYGRISFLESRSSSFELLRLFRQSIGKKRTGFIIGGVVEIPDAPEARYERGSKGIEATELLMERLERSNSTMK